MLYLKLADTSVVQNEDNVEHMGSENGMNTNANPVRRLFLWVATAGVLLIASACHPMRPAINTSAPIDTLTVMEAFPFTEGTAYLQADSASSFYIDSTGHRMFTRIVERYEAVDSMGPNTNGYVRVYRDEAHPMRIVQQHTGQYGVVDDSGRWVMPAKYDSLQLVFNRYLAVYKDGMMTYADTRGQLLVPLQFEEVGMLSDTLFDVRRGDRWGVFNTEQDALVLPVEYEAIDACGGCSIPLPYVYAQKEGHWGVVNWQNETLVPFQYGHHHMNMRADGWVSAFNRGGTPVTINIATGTAYKEPAFTAQEIVNSQFIVAKNRGDSAAVGMIGEDGRTVIPFKYQSIRPLAGGLNRSGYLSIEQNNKFGVINTQGTVIIVPTYDHPLRMEGRFFITKEEKGRRMLTPAGAHVDRDAYFSTIRAILMVGDATLPQPFVVYTNRLAGLYIPESNTFVEPEFDAIRTARLSRDEWLPYMIIEKEGFVGLYDAAGNQLLPPVFESLNFLTPSIARIEQNDEYALVNVHKKTISPNRYEAIYPIANSDSLFKVRSSVEGVIRYGLIDAAGNQLVPPRYQDMAPLDTLGYHWLMNAGEGHYQLWDRPRQAYQPLPFSNVSPTMHSNLLMVYDSTEVTLWNWQQRKELFPNGRFDSIVALNNGLFVVIKEYASGARYGYANARGQLVVPVAYDVPHDRTSFDFNDDRYLPLYAIDDAGIFRQGVAARNGKVLVPPRYHQVLPEVHGRGFLTERNYRLGVVDSSGRELLPPAYDILLQNPLHTYKNEACFSFPILVRTTQGNAHGAAYSYYINGKGQRLPVKVINGRSSHAW